MKLIQIFIAFALMAIILIQNRGTGLSGIFGGGNNVYRTKRGVEKILFTSAIILSILFFLVSLSVVIL